jgi:hypothetical protein
LSLLWAAVALSFASLIPYLIRLDFTFCSASTTATYVTLFLLQLLHFQRLGG